MNVIGDLKKYRRPETISGIYILFETDSIVYIGQSWDIFVRIAKHASYWKPTKIINWDFYSYIEISDRAQRLELEKELLRRYNPKYNKNLCDKEDRDIPRENVTFEEYIKEAKGITD